MPASELNEVTVTEKRNGAESEAIFMVWVDQRRVIYRSSVGGVCVCVCV